MYSTGTLSVGTHTITASYAGNSSFSSSSGTLTGGQTVNKAGTSTGVSSSANPSVSGQLVTFTATVTVMSPGTTAAANPTGTVIFRDGGTSIAQGMLSTNAGVTTATFSTSTLTIGNHTITASFAGDNNFLTSTGTLTQTVNNPGTTT